ncbi:choice-of-anchor M domain-containing protein [Corynebacterium pelargi]|uniref:Uncharacterized protein n=1 Tax=Corynebacterium pelargi TaxID=1471400 RepID=A0A410W6X9_9CORY|nr:choice-of-anchor M domain-containing protein [Corynebacterium pelargi]QAU51577.1 hypothetical protein CPELA_01385 [Corynebacterium pelargi]GGG82463.1 hypothetical protein GCM10007338_21730 [Corynebacterium pelargi]
MLQFRGLIGILTTLIVMAFAAQPASAQELNDPIVFDSGHIDAFNVTSDGNSLHLNLKEDITGQHVQRAPESTILQVKPEAYREHVPGLELGGYLLPLSQDPNLLWPGWDTLGVAQGGLSSIDLEFQSIEGPGRIFLFTQSGLGGGIEPLLNNGLELQSGSVRTQPDPAHTHAYWLFEQPGTYTMQVAAAQTGGGLRSAPRTYTWQVGDAADAPQEAAPTLADVPEAAPEAEQEVCEAHLEPKIRDDRTSPGQWRSTDELLFGLGSAAATTTQQSVGSIPEGTKVWAIGSVQQAGVPWLGANTQAPSLLEHGVDAVTYEITGFQGPGVMEVFVPGDLGGSGATSWFHGDANGASGSVAIPHNSHVHPSWVFDTPGQYDVTITQTANTADGQTLQGQATLHFVVDGSGNADDGHFDFGSEVSNSCTTTAAVGAVPPVAGAGRGALANTAGGPLTGAILTLGAGWLLLGAAVLYAARKEKL